MVVPVVTAKHTVFRPSRQGKKGAGEVWNRRRAGVPEKARRESDTGAAAGVTVLFLSSEYRRMPPRDEQAP